MVTDANSTAAVPLSLRAAQPPLEAIATAGGSHGNSRTALPGKIANATALVIGCYLVETDSDMTGILIERNRKNAAILSDALKDVGTRASIAASGDDMSLWTT